jgi:hypothetical protein
MGRLVSRLHFAGIGVIVAALALSHPGAAASERDQVIRLGKGIGKIQLGMTLPAVRRALGGRHDLVYRRQDFGTRGRYVELGWEFPGRTWWEPNLWHVGFRSWSRRGMLRVVRVSTSARRERTRRGIGIGSRVRDITRAYPHATCVYRYPPNPYAGTWIVVEEPSGVMTAFNVVGRRDDPDAPRRVVEVMVQRVWFSKGRWHGACHPGWEHW